MTLISLLVIAVLVIGIVGLVVFLQRSSAGRKSDLKAKQDELDDFMK
jgi:preprotein translocase subunit SecG